MRKVSRKQEENKMKNLFMNILYGQISGLIAFLVLLSIFALIIVKADISGMIVDALAMVSAALSAFISGFATTRQKRSRGIYMGSMSGLILMVFIITILLAISKGNLGSTVYFLIPVTLIPGAIGGIFAVNKRKRVK